MGLGWGPWPQCGDTRHVASTTLSSHGEGVVSPMDDSTESVMSPDNPQPSPRVPCRALPAKAGTQRAAEKDKQALRLSITKGFVSLMLLLC